jgi:nucleoside-diphosphate-sugar epimerase
MLITHDLPDKIIDEETLDRALARPSERLLEFFRKLDGDVMILGVAGKMGASLARLAVEAGRLAGVRKRVIGVARFSDSRLRERLVASGIEAIACDLLDRASVAALPRVANVIYMAGRKFGTQGEEDQTWAMNVVAPANAAEHFRQSRIVAFSTGCVYPLVSTASGGSREEDAVAPVGEYAQSCVGRERVFAYFSQTHDTPLCTYRLNYATDLRYGVLHDIGRRVWAGQPVDLNVGYFNTIWQGDANHGALLALALCAVPPDVLNVTGPELLSTREVAEEFGRLMGKDVSFTGAEGDRNYLNNAARYHRLFGLPAVPAERLIRWQAHWLMAGGPSLGKPTHFEVSDGSY